MEAAKCIHGKPRGRKKPISLDTLKKIAETFNGPNASLSDLRVCFIFLIGFSGFLRCDKLIHIQRKHIRILDAHISKGR